MQELGGADKKTQYYATGKSDSHNSTGIVPPRLHEQLY